MEEKSMITITKEEYIRLVERDIFLDCLEACGVDNWEGHSEANQMMELERDGE